MSEFEMRREEYFNVIRDNPDIINKIVADNNNTEQGKKMLEILITPKNERELDGAEILFTFISSILSLLENEMKEIPNEENKGFKEYIRIINGLKEGKEDSELVVRDYPSRDCAKILYDSFVSFLADPYAFSEYIAKETGFDLEDEFESRQFNVYMEHAKRIMNENDVSSKNLVDCTKEEIEKSRKIVNEFSRLCQDGKVSYDDEEKVFEKRNKNS